MQGSAAERQSLLSIRETTFHIFKIKLEVLTRPKYGNPSLKIFRIGLKLRLSRGCQALHSWLKSTKTSENYLILVHTTLESLILLVGIDLWQELALRPILQVQTCDLVEQLGPAQHVRYTPFPEELNF